MNYEIGGARVLQTLLAISWLIFGGVAAAIYFGSAPTNLPYSVSQWHSMCLGVSAGALLAAHVFLNLLTEHRKASSEAPGGGEFAVSLWGFAAAFLGWLASLGCAIATAGGWEPPISSMYGGALSAGLATVVLIGVIWFTPIAVLLFFGWLADGFASKQG